MKSDRVFQTPSQKASSLKAQHHVSKQYMLHQDILNHLGESLYHSENSEHNQFFRDRIDLHVDMQNELFSLSKEHGFSHVLSREYNDALNPLTSKVIVTSILKVVLKKINQLKYNLSQCIDKNDSEHHKLFVYHFYLLAMLYSSKELQLFYK